MRKDDLEGMALVGRSFTTSPIMQMLSTEFDTMFNVNLNFSHFVLLLLQEFAIIASQCIGFNSLTNLLNVICIACFANLLLVLLAILG